MADSNITKKALAHALKTLLQTHAFEKISVGMICEECGLNRKSFYYHFKDKYELVNWIYYTEFIKHTLHGNLTEAWELVESICDYLYENRDFYKKTFQTEGQNSFSEYFHSIISSILLEDLSDIYQTEPSVEPYVEFYSDAFVCSFRKWITKRDCMSAQDFAHFLKTAIMGVSKRAVKLYGTHQEAVDCKKGLS